MKKKVKFSRIFFRADDFIKDIALLFAGTTISQLIPIIISPLLTRFYSPDDFGIFSLYAGIVSVLSVISTGQYDLAITLPKKEKDSASILLYTIKICSIFCLMIYIPIIFCDDLIVKIFRNSELASFLYLVPISIIISSSYNSFQYWLNKISRYKEISINRMCSSFFVSFLNVFFGLMAFKKGLILGSILGQAVSLLLIVRRIFLYDWDRLKKSDYKSQKKQAKKYMKHPLYIMPSQCISIAAQQIPIIIMATLSSLASSGFFALAYRVVSLPTSLIANAVGDVFRQKASELFHMHGEIKELYITTLKSSFMISVPFFLLLFFGAPYAFEYAFGSTWKICGEYAKILSIPTFLQFFITPVDKVFLIYQKQNYEIFVQIYRFIALFLVFYISSFCGLDGKKVVFLISIAFSSTYIIVLILSFRLVFCGVKIKL